MNPSATAGWRPPSRRALVARALLGLSLFAPAARAQVVSVLLRDDSTGGVVAGAIVRLVQQENVLAQGLSDERGRILLRAPRAGIFRLRTDRIGFPGLWSDPFALGVGDTLHTALRLPSTRLALPTIEVRARSPCDAYRQEGSAAALLWDDIRTALTANLLTQEERAVPLRTTLFERDVTPAGRARPERILGHQVVTGQPFRSYDASELARRGFVYWVGDSVTFAGPDAALLLSDDFVSTHCFHAVRGGPGRAGLAFEPVPGRGVPDIRGVLWVDSATIELRFLEFEYTGLTGVLEGARAGGRVEFRRLASGAWVVGEWHIRAPRVEASAVGVPGRIVARQERLSGYRERGGRTELADGRPALTPGGLVRGVVFDSLAGTHLPGAVVRLSGTSVSTETGPDGSFALPVSVPGEYDVVASHARLGLIPDGSRRTVNVLPGGETQIEITVPSLPAIVRTLCGEEKGPSGIVGLTWGEGDAPEEGRRIRATWLAYTAPGVRGRANAIVRSGPRGLYALCHLPSDRELTLQLLHGLGVVAERSLILERGEFRWVELRPGGRL